MNIIPLMMISYTESTIGSTESVCQSVSQCDFTNGVEAKFKVSIFSLVKFKISIFLISDWIIFHDQPVPGCHRNPILGDEKARNGAHENGASAIHFL